MLIKISEPDQWSRVNDTNRMAYRYSSTNVNQPNFQYQFELFAYDISGVTTNLGTFNIHPAQNGEVYFNPSTIYSNYLGYDLSLSSVGVVELERTARKFRLDCYEFYGAPPTRIGASLLSGSTLNVYNGCQQFIPYDESTYNPDGNLQWVMGVEEVKRGKYLTDVIEQTMDNDSIYYLYALGDKATGRPTGVRYTIWYAQFKTAMFSTISGSTTVTVVQPSNQYNYPYYNAGDLIFGNPNIPSGTTITTVAGDYTLIISDAATATVNNRLTYLQSNITFSNWTFPNMTPLTSQAMPVTTQKMNLIDPAPADINPPFILVSAVTYSHDVDWQYDHSLGYQISCGPRQLIDASILSNYKDKWLYYDIDLVASGDTKVLNKYPMRIIRGDICDKYDRWQLFWLNPHGGFDTFTFNKKNDLDYKIQRRTYKVKLNPTFDVYQAGERVFNVNIEEQVTLRTRLLYQRESQLLIQLTQSPVVYLLKDYTWGSGTIAFGVPYIVVTDSIKYEQKVNSKEIVMEIKIRPSNERIIQKN